MHPRTSLSFAVFYALAGVLFLSVLATGCATHVPASESVLFHEGATAPTHTNEFGIGGTGTLSPVLASPRADARRSSSDRRRSEDAPPNDLQAGGGLFLAAYDGQGHYAISGTVGILVAGLDATVQLRGRNYLTAGYSVPNQGQVFLLHRTVNSPQVGAAVGIGGRYEQYAFSEGYGLSIDMEEVASIGTRGFILLRDRGDTKGGIKAGTYVGYVPELNSPVVALTLTVGRF